MLCCYYTNILFTNPAIWKMTKTEYCKQNGTFTVLLVKDENDLQGPVPMSKAIFKQLNHS